MIIKYNIFLNEKISDKMLGLSENEILNNLKDKPDDLIKLGFKYNSYKFISAALKNGDLSEYDTDSIFTYLIKNDKYELFEKILINEDIDINEIDETDMVNVFEKLSYNKFQLLILKYLNNKHLLKEILLSVISNKFISIINIILDKNVFEIEELNDMFISIDTSDNDSVNIIKIFLEHNVDINYENSELLLNALGNGNYDVIKFLLEHGAKIIDNKYFKNEINFLKNSTSQNNKKIYELIK